MGVVLDGYGGGEVVTDGYGETSGAVAPPAGGRRLESGAGRLLESGGGRLMETGVPRPGRRLLESGAFRLTEAGGFRLMEAIGGLRIRRGLSVVRHADTFQSPHTSRTAT